MAPPQRQRAIKSTVRKKKAKEIYERGDMKEWNDIEKLIVEDSEKMGMPFKEEFWDEMENILDDNEAIIPIVPASGVDHLDAADDGPFREEYWDEMSLILDQEDRKKRRALLWRWAGDLAAILLITFILVQPKNTGIIDSSDRALSASKETSNKTNNTTTKPSPEKLESTTPDNTQTELQVNNAFHSVQPTQGEQTEPAEPVLNRMETVANLDETRPSDTPSSNSFVDDGLGLTDIGTLNTDEIRTMDMLNPGISYTKSLDSKNGRIPRMRIRPLSVRLFAASNLALAPEGNVSDASRLGSSNQLGIEVLKHQVNWSYSLGMNFAHRTGLNHELLLEKSTYGARLYREYQSVTYKSIGSIGIPVGVNYHHRRNVFGIRMTPTWNVMVNSTYHRYNNYSSDELLVENNYGIKEGINAFDLRLQLMYERRITERFSLGVNFAAGLFNQIDETLIPNTKGLYEYSVGVNASYTLMKF
jgi:hypothetical protein